MDRRLDRETHIGKGRQWKVIRRKADSYPLHAHEYYEIEIILSGRGIHRVGEQEYPLERGCTYILSPADFHSVEVTEPMELWNIAFDTPLTHPIKTPVLRRLTEAELKKIHTVAQLLEQEEVHFQPLLDYLLALLIPAAEEPLSPIRQAIVFIENHFRENPSLAEAAEQACLSPVYFGALFKKETGETYVSYLNSCKVRCAAMLLESGMSVAEACFASGFGSLSGFLYTYKQKMGFSPSKSILSKKKE